MVHKKYLFSFLAGLLSLYGTAQNESLRNTIITNIQKDYDQYKTIALNIWNYAEVGYKEEKSSALLQQNLKEKGFNIQKGVAGIPTAFIASYGSGSPVIGILAEYDALPGLAQEAAPEKKEIKGKDAGHGCGHHLFGTASMAAAIEVKKLMEQGKLKGTIRLYGTPAEEGGSGKVYMVREGLFKDVDVVLHWHPDDENGITTMKALANTSAKFRFSGISAHASDAPDKGRSSLDAVESMNYMVNMMREHVPSNSRIHYVITNGGKSPNVVPYFAELYYYVRHPDREVVRQLFDRVVKAANGAAMGTETKMSYEIIGGTYDLLINKSLAGLMQANLEKVGGINYTTNEIAFGKKIQTSFNYSAPAVESAAKIKELKLDVSPGGGSTDVGDVSWNVPTVGLRAATWIPGTAAHSWQAVACGGTEIGTKGMIVAAKVMAMTAVDLYTNPSTIKRAKEEFQAERASNFTYQPLLGNREPALNYRD